MRAERERDREREKDGQCSCQALLRICPCVCITICVQLLMQQPLPTKIPINAATFVLFFCKKWQLQFKFSGLFVLPCCCCCCYRFSKIPSHASDKLTENKICQGGDRHRIRLYQQPFCIPGFESQLSKSTRLFSSSM